MAWHRNFLTGRFSRGSASFRFGTSVGRGGIIEYTDHNGSFVVPYQLGAGDVAYEVDGSAIRDILAMMRPVDASIVQSIVSNINDAITQREGKKVALI